MDLQDRQTPDSGGVSRSGRVRKKSARLAEFESSEESDVKTPKKKTAPKSGSSQKTSKQDATLSDLSMDSEDSDLDDDAKEESDKETWDGSEDTRFLDPLSNADEANNPRNSIRESPFNMTEKKKVHGARKRNRRATKSEKKIRGTSSINAYVLWSKEARADLVEQNPQMEFSAINKKLGEMWAKVPVAQKQTYNRMARKLAAQENKTPTSQMIRTGKNPKRTKTKAQPKARVTKETAEKSMAMPTQVLIKTPVAAPVVQKPPTPITPTNDTNVTASVFKVNGISPIDVSAHLKLLGESLNNIGQKLKENEGQIAVSGSLSVLLDSMLCVLGPLACLTEQLEETRGAIGHDTLNGILDNIAYIMPGIV